MKQESEYGHCFDFMFIDGGFEKPLQTYLQDEFGMEVIKISQFEERVIALLEWMHDEGIVRPVKKVDGEEIQNRFACPTCDRTGWISFEQLQKAIKAQ